MDARFVYDIPYVKEVLGYLLIPFLIFVIVSCTFLMIYALTHKDHEDIHYKYKMSLFTLVISTLLVASLFAILVGFALSFKRQVDAANIKSFVVYVVLASPFLPFFSFLALLFKMIRLIKNRPNKYESNEDEVIVEEILPVESVVDEGISITEIPSVIKDSVVTEEVLEEDKVVPLEVLPVVEETPLSIEELSTEDIETL